MSESKPFLEIYNSRIDKSKYNTETGEYVKGSSIIMDVPILVNKSTGEKNGTLGIQIVTMKSHPDEVLFIAEVYNEDRECKNVVHVWLPHESCREIGNVIGATIFEPKHRLGN